MHSESSSTTTVAPSDVPRSAAEAVIGLLMQAGRRLRTRHPEDQVEPSCFPIAKQLFREPMRISDIAARVELDSSTVSRQIKSLEDRGLVERTTDPADGRASLVQLSEQGRQTMHAAFQRRFQRIEGVLEAWSERDRADLRRLLIRLAADLQAAHDHEESSNN
jgi:DNA-binding MarR family transcriptional regulator